MTIARAAMLLAVTMTVTMGCAVAPAAEYFLSPTGDDANAGSHDAPWQTLEKASETARAGDTIILLPGEYPGTLQPLSSGTADAPIVFRAEERLEAILAGPERDAGEAAVVLDGVSHVSVEGLRIVPETSRIGWVFVRDCSHILIDDCYMDQAVGPPPFRIDRSEQIRVRDNVIHRHTGGNMIVNNNNARLVFEGNTISRTGHCPWQLTDNRYVVARGNVFHAAWGRPFADRSTEHMLFEHNIVTHAYNSGRSASSNAKFVTTRGIFRFNRVFRNIGGAINLYPFNPGGDLPEPNPLLHIRLYHNVFDDNAHYGIGFGGSAHDRTEDVLFVNNIFSRNDRYGSQRQINLSGGTPEQVRLVRNVFAALQPDLPVVRDYDEFFTVAQVQDEPFQAEHGARYEDNMQVDPGFVAPAIYDHALREDSPMRDAGMPLTRARGAGQGTLLAVEDPFCFYDGFGIEGERGDLIAVGAADRQARVLEVDHEAHTLRLDRELSWSDGDPVSLPWSGAAPDIGVFEHGPNGRVSMQVIVEPFEARPGDEVTLRAVVHGDAIPREIRWWLGDGTVAEGAQITHRYAEEYDYAIRVRMTDERGEVHRGAGYAWIAEPADPNAPLIHTTWERDDDSAWWLWKSYRPGPASFQDLIDGETGRGYRRMIAPRDGGRLPAQIHPAGWDLDLYPRIFIRYRVGEGTPIAITLRAFSGPSVIVAASAAARVSEDAWVTDHLLHDDEQWHEVEMDARVILERNPGVQVLEGLRIGAAPHEDVREGHWYELDEVIIGP